MMRILLTLFLLIGLLCSPSVAVAGELGEPDDYRTSQKDDDDDDKGDEESEEEKKKREEAEQKRRDKAPRVVILKWPQTDMKRGISASYLDEGLRRNVRSRIDRPDALFFPSVDLYQNGRKAPDKTLMPINQPAFVDDAQVQFVLSEIERISQIPYSELTGQEWTMEARKLRSYLDDIWFVEGVDHREPLFLLYAQLGRAADNIGLQNPPFFENIASQSVNYYWYLAATLAWQDASLMNKLTDADVRGPVDYLLKELQASRFPTFPLDLELENEFDLEKFEEEYTVFLNGLAVAIDESAQVQIPLGVTDIYLKRNDTGSGLSERLSVDKFEDKAYFVRDVARKRMGLEFIDQLMLHPNECTPELDGDILNFLSIYAKLHNKAEIYIAVPVRGSANKIFIWRYDRTTATLQLVQGSGDQFPVHFAVLASGGLLYNTAAIGFDPDVDQGDASGVGQTGIDATSEAESRTDIELNPAMIPVTLELRAHYNRLMVGWGWEFGYGFSGFSERYFTPGHAGEYEWGDLVVVETGSEGTARLDDNGDPVLDQNGDPIIDPPPEILHRTNWNRYTYGTVGVVLGRDAALGIGPRFAARLGWSNLPHAFQPTAHFGWAIENPLFKGGDRVRPIIDADLRGGVVVAAKNSILRDQDKVVSPLFGLSIGLGTTF